MANHLTTQKAKEALSQFRTNYVIDKTIVKGAFQNVSAPPYIFGPQHRSRRSRYGNKW